jgi:hypothetical protein
MAVTVASLMAVLDIDKKKFEKGLKDAQGRLNKVGDALKGGLLVAGGAAAAGLAAAGTAAVNFENDLQKATSNLATNLGISADEAAQFEDTLTGIFATRPGRSLEEIAEAVGLIDKSIEGLDQKQLEALAGGALDIERQFGKDLNETVDAAAVLMDEFGLSGQEALNFIEKGLTEGLDRSGDFLDSVREYGNLFGEAEADAGEFFSILESGAQGGVLGTDKVADAFKEFQIRALEGSDAVYGAFEDMGLSWDQFAQGLSDGSLNATDAFATIIDRLNQIEDPIERQRLGVALMGTQFEDLGQTAAGELSTVSTSLGDIQDLNSTLGEQYDTLGGKFGQLKNQALVGLAPVGEIIASGLTDFIEGAIPIVQEFAASFSENLGPATMVINDALTRMGQALGITNEKVTGMDVILSILKGTLDAIVIGVQATAVVMSLLADSVEWVTQTINEGVAGWQKFGDSLGALKDKAPDWIIPGSPTPFERGIRGITSAMKALPDMDGALSLSGGTPIASAAGGASSTINIDMGGQSLSFSNDDQGINQAMIAIVQMLRSQISNQ